MLKPSVVDISGHIFVKKKMNFKDMNLLSLQSSELAEPQVLSPRTWYLSQLVSGHWGLSASENEAL